MVNVTTVRWGGAGDTVSNWRCFFMRVIYDPHEPLPEDICCETCELPLTFYGYYDDDEENHYLLMRCDHCWVEVEFKVIYTDEEYIEECTHEDCQD